MKTTLYIIAFVVTFSLLGRIHITFKPFSISFESLWFAIGWILLTIGVLCIGYYYQNQGEKIAYKEISQLVEKIEKDQKP